MNGNDIAEEGAWVWASDNRPFNYTAWYTCKDLITKKKERFTRVLFSGIALKAIFALFKLATGA